MKAQRGRTSKLEGLEMNDTLITELNKILSSANDAQSCFAKNNEREALYYINGIQARVKRLLENEVTSYGRINSMAKNGD